MKTIEELEAELETVTRERNDLAIQSNGFREQYEDMRSKRDRVQGMLHSTEVLLSRVLDETTKKDYACIECEKQLRREMASIDFFMKKSKDMERERDEARAEVERLTDASTHWQVLLKRETEEVERLERLLEIERMGIRPVDEVRCDAYRRGAEAMREACATMVLTSMSWQTRPDEHTADEIAESVRALPIPEE